MRKSLPPKKLEVYVCTECMRTFTDGGLCSYGCKFDAITFAERSKKQIVMLTYELASIGTKPVVRR